MISMVTCNDFCTRGQYYYIYRFVIKVVKVDFNDHRNFKSSIKQHEYPRTMLCDEFNLLSIQ